MIALIDLDNGEVAGQLLAVQKAAYTIEAEMIDSFAIPALHETVADLQQCGETFYGYWQDEQLAGAISYKREGTLLDIYRLVVHPVYFRRGIGKALVRHVELVEENVERIVVSTGAKNVPAKMLYTSLGFVECGEREVAPGLLITLFEKHIISQQHVPFFQRFQPADPDALARKVEQDYEELAHARIVHDEQMQLACLNRLGSRLTMLGKEKLAAPVLEQALPLARRLGEKRLEIAVLLNLATALQYLGKRNQAQELFQEVLDNARAYEQFEYEDFILQHRGRCFVEQGQKEEARICFEQALVLRKRKGDQRGIDATQQALDAL